MAATRRPPLLVGATVAGLGAVVGLNVGAPASIAPVARATASANRHAQGNGGSARSAGSSGSSSGGGGQTSSSGSAGAVPPLLANRRAAVGASERYGYGILAVRVTVVGTRIQDVTVERLQTAEQYSQQLAQQVIPMLRSEVLSAQSAHINGISGASYTSQAYAYSVQSALDKLHVA